MPFTPSNRTITAPSGSSVIRFGRNSAPVAPVAEFIGAPLSGTVPLAVTFTDQSTGVIETRAWVVRRNGVQTHTSSSTNPTLVFADAGVYDVELTVGGPGGSDVLTRTAYITATSINLGPSWNGAGPTNLGTFQAGAQSTVDLSGYATDPEGDPMYFARTGGAEDTAPAGVTVSQAGLLTVPADLPNGNYSITVDVSSAPAAAIVELQLVGGGDGIPWTIGQVFAKGDAPSWLDVVAVTGTLSAAQVDVRNRWSDGSVKFAAISGIGATRVQIRSTATEPATGTVALGTVAASVTISDVADYLAAPLLAGPVTVTMPNTTTPATFGADPAAHVAGLVRSIPGPVMTEYHYYAPVPGEPHLAVWWYVRAYSNGAREVETLVECTPWVTVAGGGRRDYTAQVDIGGSTRMASTAVEQYARTSWSRVDWVGSAHSVKPRHDADYLRLYAFPFNNLATPNVDALNYGMATEVLVANSYAEAMAPPVNNPGSQLQWPNEIGATGTGGMLRTNIEAAYAAGADSYWSAEAHARSAGRYPIHVRDPITGRPWNIARNPDVKDGESYTGGYWSESASRNAGWKTSHAPPLGSGAYLLSGRYVFLERMQQQAAYQPLIRNQAPASTARYGYRFGGPYTATSITPDVREGAWMQWGYVNQAAWSPETLGNAAISNTFDSELRTAMAPYIERFMLDMRDAFVAGTIEGGRYANTLGCVSWSPAYLGSYSDQQSSWGDNFMQTYVCFVLHAGLDLDLPISASAKLAQAALYQFAMSRVVSTYGTWSGSGWNYRYESQHLPYGPIDGDDVLRWPPAAWYTSYGQVWTALLEVRGTGSVNEINLSDADGGNLTKYSEAEGYAQISSIPRSESNLTSNSLQRMSSLALAVDRGVPGAAAAWARLQSSPTLQAAATLDNIKDYPATVFTPRSLA